jgi:hypothetical protein
MKTKQIITSLLSILIMLCFTIAFTGCNNDDDDNDPSTVAYRVAEKAYTDIYGSDIYEDKDLYNYMDNRLIEVIDLDKEDGVWEEDRKTEYTYDGDWVTSHRYKKEGNEWVTEGMQGSDEMKIVNGKIMEIKNTYPNDVYRQVFTYNGDKIVKVERFYNDELNEKYVCTYNGDKIDEIIEYDYYNGYEELDYKYEFSYTNGNLTEVLAYYYDDGVWVNSDRDVYTYSGDKVIRIDDYDFNNYTNVWELDDSTNFSYNSLGLLESISRSGEGWSWEELFTYEEGLGNYKLLRGEGGYYSVFNYPIAQRINETNTSSEDNKFSIIQSILHLNN